MPFWKLIKNVIYYILMSLWIGFLLKMLQWNVRSFLISMYNSTEPETSTHNKSFPTLCVPNFLIKPKYICSDHGSGLKILMIVTSAVRHFKRRQTIRVTWGREAKREGIAFAFVLGTSSNEEINEQILSESIKHGDIIQGDFADTYNNLTFKTMCAIRYFEKTCSEANFFMKLDDDVLVITDNLLKFLEKNQHKKLCIWGRSLNGVGPNRNKESKYFMPEELYPNKLYPNYIEGPAYIMTNQTAIILSQNAENETYYHIEDMFFTGLLADKVGIPREHSHNIINSQRVGVKLRDVITLHHCLTGEMVRLLAQFNSPDFHNQANPYEHTIICRGH